MKPCCHPGCPKLTEGRYCEEHEALHRGERKSSSGRGYNSKWQRARKRFLKEHPLCCKCEEEGKYVRATVVDHIKPHRGDPILFSLTPKGTIAKAGGGASHSNLQPYIVCYMWKRTA